MRAKQNGDFCQVPGRKAVITLVNHIVVNQAVNTILSDTQQLDGAMKENFFAWLSLHIEQESPVCTSCPTRGTEACVANWLKKHATSVPVFFAEYRLILSKTKIQESDLLNE